MSGKDDQEKASIDRRRFLARSASLLSVAHHRFGENLPRERHASGQPGGIATLRQQPGRLRLKTRGFQQGGKLDTRPLTRTGQTVQLLYSLILRTRAASDC